MQTALNLIFFKGIATPTPINQPVNTLIIQLIRSILVLIHFVYFNTCNFSFYYIYYQFDKYKWPEKKHK